MGAAHEPVEFAGAQAVAGAADVPYGGAGALGEAGAREPGWWEASFEVGFDDLFDGAGVSAAERLLSDGLAGGDGVLPFGEVPVVAVAAEVVGGGVEAGEQVARQWGESVLSPAWL